MWKSLTHTHNADRARQITEDIADSKMEHVRKVLWILNMENLKLTSTPLATSIQMTEKDSPSAKAEKEHIKGIPYPSAIGILMYSMVASRPDFAYVVVVVGWCMENLGKKHWGMVKHILWYLCGTLEIMTYRTTFLKEYHNQIDQMLMKLIMLPPTIRLEIVTNICVMFFTSH